MSKIKTGNWEKIKNLPKEVREEIDKISACERACKKLIEETVKHYETNDIANRELWRVLQEKYNLKTDEFEYRIEGSGLYKRPLMESKIDEFVKNSEFQTFMRDHLRRAFKDL